VGALRICATTFLCVASSFPVAQRQPSRSRKVLSSPRDSTPREAQPVPELPLKSIPTSYDDGPCINPRNLRPDGTPKN
jgi:hypothetical protein